MGAMKSQPEDRGWSEAPGNRRNVGRGRSRLLPLLLLGLVLGALAIAFFDGWPLAFWRLEGALGLSGRRQAAPIAPPQAAPASGRRRGSWKRLLSVLILGLALAALAIGLLQVSPLSSARLSRAVGLSAGQGAPPTAGSLPALARVIERDLQGPLAVAVDPTTGYIFAADSGNGLVKVFSPEGKLQRTIGRPKAWEPGPGELAYPVGLALDGEGRLYVSDNVGKHISVFRVNNGEFLAWLGEAEGRAVGPGGMGKEGSKPFDTP